MRTCMDEAATGTSCTAPAARAVVITVFTAGSAREGLRRRVRVASMLGVVRMASESVPQVKLDELHEEAGDLGKSRRLLLSVEVPSTEELADGATRCVA